MRVPNISIYNNARYHLGGLTGDLQDANEVMATQKRINRISDDPIGLSQVLNLKTSIENLGQIEKNVNMGISWLKGAETALDSVNSLILDAKTQVSRLINASMGADERRNAVAGINAVIEQIVSLGNTQVNGNYIFSGLDNDIAPLVLQDAANPTRVSYQGNKTPFEIKTDKQVTVAVGRSGAETFWDKEVDINSTNNTLVFKEDNGRGQASEKTMIVTIEEGIYTVQKLELAVRNALNQASAGKGYGVSYEVAFDEDTRSFAIREDGSYDGYIRTEFMWETGAGAYVANISAASSIARDDIHVTVNHPSALTLDTTEPFRLTWQGNGQWAVANNPGYIIYPSTVSGTSRSVGIDLDESGTADITITLDTPVTERGQYIEFDIVSAKGDHSIGHEIGFNADNAVYAPPTSDRTAVFITDLTIAAGVNDTIVFEEVNALGVPSGPLTATIPAAVYTDMKAFTKAMETALEGVSANAINYAVSYDSEQGRFNIREDGSTLDELRLNWTATPVSQATAATLGFYPQDDVITYPLSDRMAQSYITIDATNNRLAFREISGAGSSDILWASINEGTYKTLADLESAVKSAMEFASAQSGVVATYTASYDPVTHRFSIQGAGGGLTGLDLLWKTSDEEGNSIGETLGFNPSNDTGGLGPYTGDTDMVLMRFDADNNVIEFEEIAVDGTYSKAVRVTIPEGDYTDMDDVAAVVQKALRDGSPHHVRYVVEYDDTAGKFTIKGSDADIKGFNLLWRTGAGWEQNASGLLGFAGDDRVSYAESDRSVVNITIDGTNDRIDFREILGDTGGVTDELTARIAQKTYTSHARLALAVETALEETSYKNGNRIDYSVTWDDATGHFTIKENGTRLAELDLLWGTGEHAPLSVGGKGGSIGGILGFEAEDDKGMAIQSDRPVDWGIFNSLIDLNGYLEDNDVYGLERSLGRLEAHFERMTSRIVDIGMKYNRLDVRNKITTEVSLGLTERRSTIEDADMIEAIMDLQAIETAYQASLSSTAKILKLSLVDYI